MPEGSEEGMQPQPAAGPDAVPKGKVFVSYASQDSAVANAVEALERASIPCWVAPRDVVAGEFYADAIVHAIDAARALVLILSKSSAASHHILREVERASSKRHPVIALRIDRASLTAGLEYFLNTSQWLALWGLYTRTGDSGERDRIRELARNAAERAVTLAPKFAEAHIALARIVRLGMYLDVGGALPEMESAIALAPGNAAVQSYYGSFQGLLGQQEVALAAIRRAIALDPQNYRLRVRFMSSLYFARRFGQALAAADEATALKPNSHEVGLYTYGSFLALGQPEKARLLCESPLAPMLLDEDNRYECFAFVYHRLGHPGEARKALQNLMSKYGDTRAFSYAEIYSQWGDSAAALRWLSTAVRARNPATALLKVDWMLDPVRNEPEFKALLVHMNFPP